MNLRIVIRCTVLALLLTALAVGLWAQATASLRGTVTDPAGAVVPGAKLMLTNVATGAARQTETEATGGYLFAALPPGMYRLRLEAKGFKTVVREGIELLVNVPVTLNLGLELGQLTEVVSVSEEAPLLNTSDATVGNVITNRQIVQLPLEARNIISLLSLQAGVTYYNNTDEVDYRNGAVNGGKSDQANITLDGVDINDQQTQYINGALRVTADSLQEFRMTTSNPTANQGRSSGAQIAMVTKGGGNSFHGSAYEFHRNTVTSANEWFFNSSSVPRRKYLKNVFGASAGGPIVKDRFFFFLNYEGRRDRTEASAVRTVPSADMRNGILSYRTAAGATRTLSAQELRDLDPGRLGANANVLAVFRQYPLPNDDSVGDRFNIRGFRFAAPVPLDQNTYIARFDFKLTSDSRHLLFWRGNLQDDKNSSSPQFPGQAGRFTNLNNSRAMAVGYTSVVTPRLVNDLRYGYTRQGLESAGISTAPTVVSFRNVDDLIPTNARSDGRKIPVHNVTDDVNWVRGAHTLNAGLNFRWVRNDRFSFARAYHNATTNVSWLLGTGADLRPSDIAGAFRVAWQDAMMATLGIVSQANARYNYTRTGQTLPLGAPVERLYGANEYEWYLQDAWKVKSNLTLTLGVRHSLFSPPWELNGNQVAPNVSLGQWFDLRGGNMQKGIPSNQAPRISFDLAGPANGGKKSFYDYDKNNFAPRVAVAYSPNWGDGWGKKLFGGPGRTSIRAGYSIAYDHIGQGLANTFDTAGGAFGMATTLVNPSSSQRSATAPRFTSLTAIPGALIQPAPPGGFPATPPAVFAITNAIDDTIRTPYSQMLTLSIQRQLPWDLSLEVGYVGRLSRKTLVQDDLAMPVDLTDPASGMTYFQAANLLVDLVQRNVPVANVPRIAFWENIFPGLATGTRTATQRAYLVYQDYRPDDTSALYDLDVGCDPACSKFGRYAFFNDQFSALSGWRSRSMGNYHGLEVLVRKRFSHGFQFDLNYTWSKSIDWASVREAAGTFSGFTVNAWSPGLQRSVSDYDTVQQLNINGVYELPFGRGKKFGSNVNSVANAIIGGWQFSGIYRHSTGLPVSVGNGRFWPTNWNITGNATVLADKGFPETGTRKNAPDFGGPNLFPTPKEALTHFENARPGQVGDRNQLRGEGLFNVDMGLSKRWRIREGHSLQLRWETFNITNSVRFDVNSLTLNLGSGATQFGKYSQTLTQPRVMQFGLRYEF